MSSFKNNFECEATLMSTKTILLLAVVEIRTNLISGEAGGGGAAVDLFS